MRKTLKISTCERGRERERESGTDEVREREREREKKKSDINLFEAETTFCYGGT
jgi:hypothetical protein